MAKYDLLAAADMYVEATTLEDYRAMSDADHRALLAGEYGDTGRGVDPVVAEYGNGQA